MKLYEVREAGGRCTVVESDGFALEHNGSLSFYTDDAENNHGCSLWVTTIVFSPYHWVAMRELVGPEKADTLAALARQGGA